MDFIFKKFPTRSIVFAICLWGIAPTFCDQEVSAQEDFPAPQLVIDEDEFNNLSSPALSNVDDAQPDKNGADQDSDSQAQAKEIERYKALLENATKHFTMLAFDLQHIALVINNGHARIANKNPIREEIAKLGSLIDMIRQQNALLQGDKAVVARLLQLTEEIAKHIRYLLTTDLITFKSFDLDPQTLITRNPQSQDIPLEELEKQLKANNILITKLEAESADVGLKWHNKVYRRLEKFNSDYKVLYGLSAVVIPLIGIYAWSVYCTDDFLGKAWNKARNKLFGTPPNNNQATNAQPASNTDTEQSSATLPPYSEDNLSDAAFIKSPEYYQQKLLYFKNQNEQYQQAATLQEAHKQKNAPSTGFKGFLGKRATRYEKKHGIKPEGLLASLQYYAEDQLGILSFTVPSIAVFELLKPKVIDWARKITAWTSDKFTQTTSFLRGGPIKRQVGVFDGKEVKVTFDDVIGNEHAKEVLSRVKAYYLDSESFDRTGIPIPSGCLLMGDTRTGKSFIAEALVGDIKMELKARGKKDDVRYWSFTTAELKQEGIERVFAAAQYYAPVIIFIDEIDSGRFQNEGDSTSLGALQVAMSNLNLDKSKKVFVLAATNKPENLDRTLLAPGRFSEKITFTYPTLDERKKYIVQELAKRAVNIPEEYIDKLAHESENCSYDALSDVITTALFKAKMRESVVTWQDLDAAFDETVNKIITDKQTLPDAEQLVIAAHQAGHAYARMLFDANLELAKVTIRAVLATIKEKPIYAKYWNKKHENQGSAPMIEYGKVFTAHNENTMKLETTEDLINELKISLAGHAAEKILHGSSSYKYHDHDLEEALAIAKHIIFRGLDEKDFPKAMREEKLTAAHKLVEQYEQEVYDLLMAHKKELTIITNFLFKEKTLLVEDILHILHLIDQEKKKGDAAAGEDQQDLDASEILKDIDTSEFDAVTAVA